MKKVWALFVFLFCVGIELFADNNLFSLPSVDPERDSAAVLLMRHKLDSVRKHENRPTVALVLAGGGAKGAAHIGVLKCIEELNIPIDLITGTSMGGLVGGLYAMGYSADKLDSLMRSIDWSVMMSDKVDKKYTSYLDKTYKEQFVLSIPFYYENEQWMNRIVQDDYFYTENSLPKPFRLGFPDGYLYGLNVNNMLSSLTVGYQDSISFANLPIPYFCVAADLVTSREKNWTEGSLIRAMRSTMSIPFLFKPVREKGAVLIDGGVRNNMPVDIAKAMGADIIIAVDLSHSSASTTNVNTIVDISMQIVTMMGAEVYKNNLQYIDVSLHPDMDGYNMMSFSSEQISDIIARGYYEARHHIDELYAVAMKTGAVGTKLSAPKAVDIGQTSIYFRSVNFTGINQDEQDYFRHRLKLDLSKPYTKKELEAIVSVIYATGCFENVFYHVTGAAEPYDLNFVCRKGPVHRVGLGARGDSQDLISLALHVGLWDNRLYGSKLDTKIKLGLCPSLDIEYAYRFKTGPKLCVIFDTRYADIDASNHSYISASSDNAYAKRFRMWTNDLSFLVRTLKQPYLDAYAGINIGNIPYYNLNDVSRMDWQIHQKVIGRLTFDTRDDNYFTQSGSLLKLDYDLVFGSNQFNQNGIPSSSETTFPAYHVAAIELSRSFPMGNFSITTALRGRFVSESYDKILFFDRNYIGGYVNGLFTSHHRAMPCFTGVNEFKPIVATANVDFRYCFAEKNFITLTASTLNQADNFKQMNFRTDDDSFVYGFSLQYGRKTFLGPLRFGLNWNSINVKEVGVYLGWGYDF